MACAQCEGIETQFSQAEARRMLRKFRRRGPDATTRLLIDAVRRAVDDARVDSGALLDIGAGVGAIHHELLDGRIARAVHLDASTAHLGVAREETERRGHSDRVEFIHGDFVALADTVPAADVVTLDRVICCYHDMERLVRRSAEKARLFYGAVYPRAVGWMRIGIVVINVMQRVKRSPFRVYLHSPAAIDAVLRSAGLSRRSARKTLGWEVVIYERAADVSATSVVPP